ncbi:MAG: ABC transporter permease [Alphaproteobacteria bacterium]
MFNFVKYLFARLAQAIIVLLITSAVAFSIYQFSGDPTDNMISQDTTAQQQEALREKLGINQPVHIQYIRFAKRALHGDFGYSWRNGQPVAKVIAKALPATIELAMSAFAFALAIGIPLGVWTALYPNHFLSKLSNVIALLGVSIPSFVVASLLIYWFSVAMANSWWSLPALGRGKTVNILGWDSSFFTRDGLEHLIMPTISLGLYQLTLVLRLVRSGMREVLQADYIRFAKARGLSAFKVNYKHALKNTLLPVITVMGMQVGGLIAFSVVTETIFNWPGVGNLFIKSFGFNDFPFISAYLLMVAFVFVSLNLIVDMLYYIIDPRLRKSSV